MALLRPVPVANRGLLALALIGAAAAAAVSAEEAQVAGALATMRGGDSTQGQAEIARFALTPARDLPLRGAAALAETALVEASRTPDPALKRLYLARAQSLIADLQARQPDWLPSLLLDAQAADVGGQAGPRAIAELVRSYALAPFLWPEGQWRIAFGAAHWRQLDAATRRHLIQEAAWVTGMDEGWRARIVTLFGDTPAGATFQLELARPSA